jgi:hypothetical protein
VLVANYASSLGGIALFAALPRHFSFVAKREFLGAPGSFAAAVTLRDVARAHVLAHCGQPDAGPP